MDRLTFPDMAIAENTIDAAAVRAYAMEFYWRLKAYEDIRLTPEEVRSMYGEWITMKAVLNGIGSYDRIRELAEADKDGRVMVLKCKPGDTVYFIRSVFQWAKEPIEARIIGMTYHASGCLYTADKSGWDQTRKFLEKEIGKTVFLTREEAEKALEEAKHGNQQEKA